MPPKKHKKKPKIEEIDFTEIDYFIDPDELNIIEELIESNKITPIHIKRRKTGPKSYKDQQFGKRKSRKLRKSRKRT